MLASDQRDPLNLFELERVAISFLVYQEKSSQPVSEFEVGGRTSCGQGIVRSEILEL